MHINVDGFIDTLPIMAKGMAGIFIVTAVIILTIVILNKATASKKKNEE